MYKYYIAFEKHYNDSFKKSWIILTTPHDDMGTSEGIIELIFELKNDFKCDVWIINWKKLDC